MTYVIALPCVDIGRFFTDVLTGLDAPLGSPGGAAKLGAVRADTPLVAALPPQSPQGRADG